MQVSLLGQATADGEEWGKVGPERIRFSCNKRAHGGIRTHNPGQAAVFKTAVYSSSTTCAWDESWGVGPQTWPPSDSDFSIRGTSRSIQFGVVERLLLAHGDLIRHDRVGSRSVELPTPMPDGDHCAPTRSQVRERSTHERIGVICATVKLQVRLDLCDVARCRGFPQNTLDCVQSGQRTPFVGGFTGQIEDIWGLFGGLIQHSVLASYICQRLPLFPELLEMHALLNEIGRAS